MHPPVAQYLEMTRDLGFPFPPPLQLQLTSSYASTADGNIPLSLQMEPILSSQCIHRPLEKVRALM